MAKKKNNNAIFLLLGAVAIYLFSRSQSEEGDTGSDAGGGDTIPGVDKCTAIVDYDWWGGQHFVTRFMDDPNYYPGLHLTSHTIASLGLQLGNTIRFLNTGHQAKIKQFGADDGSYADSMVVIDTPVPALTAPIESINERNLNEFKRSKVPYTGKFGVVC